MPTSCLGYDMRRFFLSALIATLAGCSSAPEVAYSGDDAGQVLLSLSEFGTPRHALYDLAIRRVDGPGETHIRLVQMTGQFDTTLDYATPEDHGIIRTARLAPGTYELYNFQIEDRGLIAKSYGPNQPFSIPFTVKTGETVYLGNFRAYPIKRPNLVGLPTPAGAFFLMSDASDRDIPAAQKRDPKLVLISTQIPNAASLASPDFTNAVTDPTSINPEPVASGPATKS